MEIIDKFLTVKQNKDIEKQLIDNYFPWYYVDQNVKGSDYYQFTHLLVLNEKINSDYFEIFTRINATDSTGGRVIGGIFGGYRIGTWAH